ncbi:hypothetical protein HELRODRAFT_183836 [Helobdella robusta]|uniref:Transmembrane protein 267 n=1 Tax=Helobdella robusta TaxID=6412 RepID=T1FK91_HELRO|nr:hypothetical protein HELRODRAFT_183836 [Helobdella robusta]ESO09792.1 hypothetical protein HELRODRAFT_183836 [Helobdella robusta]
MHASVAGMSWFLVIYPQHPVQRQQQQFNDLIFFGYGNMVAVAAEVLLCAAISSLIDLDHFLEASSFSLDKALSLSRRPPLHNTSVIVLTSIVLLLISRFTDIRFLKVLPFLFLISTLTHHLRDALDSQTIDYLYFNSSFVSKTPKDGPSNQKMQTISTDMRYVISPYMSSTNTVKPSGKLRLWAI